MSVDPRFLYHAEEESLRYRVGDSSTKSREELDRRFESCGFRQGFCGKDKDEMRYSNGDDEDDECVQRRNSLIQPGGWELVVRDDDEEKKSSMDRHNKVTIASNTDGNVSSSQCCYTQTQAKRGFASVDKERVTSFDSLKSILSDPVTGALMSDAAILPCGHSFGAGGLKEVKRMKACYTCSQPTSEGSEKPNLSLRIVVHAFCQEEESDHVHSFKPRKESTRELSVSRTSQILIRIIVEAFSFLSPLGIESS